LKLPAPERDDDALAPLFPVKKPVGPDEKLDHVKPMEYNDFG
jgi:hypothetical protein